MRTSDFNYSLPPDLIAQSPTPSRGGSRLLILQRKGGLVDAKFTDLLEWLRPGDVLVVNNSRVIPARLMGLNLTQPGAAAFEVLLLEELGLNDWWVMLRPGKKGRLHTQIAFNNRAGQPTFIQAQVIDINAEGHRRLRFTGTPDIEAALDELGVVPLPPYIKRPPGANHPEDRERYQTIYAEPRGSVAAPTAGLHFTESLLRKIGEAGVKVHSLTLHTGLGTFAPVKVENVCDHVMHEERYDVGEETAAAVNAAKAEKRRVLAVGTTTVRVLEGVAAANDGVIKAGAGRTRLFIHPPWRFRVVDGLLTNFHLPCSTLLMLVSAFAAPGETLGRERVLSAYQFAIQNRFRFFSYGDAMLLI